MNNNLKNVRALKNMTQAKLSTLTDIRITDLSKIENCCVFPYPGWRKKISKALSVDESQIWPDVFKKG